MSVEALRQIAARPPRRCVSRVAATVGVMGMLGMACRPPESNATGRTTTRSVAATRIVCSFLPVYIFTLNVVGDSPGIEVLSLLPSSAGCPHDYDLSVSDVKIAATAEVLVLHGGLERFAGEDLRRINPRATQIEAWQACDRIAESELDEPPAAAHGHQWNPHVWLSVDGAICEVHAIAEGLARAIPRCAPALRANGEAYIGRLERLKSEFATTAPRLKGARIVTTHDAFAYLARDLGLKVAATIHADPRTEPSPARLARVIRTIRAQRVRVVIREAGPAAPLAERVAAEAGVPVRELDPIVSATESPSPDYYERVMRANLRVLNEVLR